VFATGVPLLGIVLVQVLPAPPSRDPRATVLALALVALAVGGFGAVLTARIVTEPLRRLRAVVERVERGDYPAQVEVSDGSEIGLLQTGVNRMVAGLRERERVRALFEKHVGEEVAEHALQLGVDLTHGEIRPVVALFVDVVDSTGLAASVPPDRMAAMLNRFFTAVVGAVDAEDGLVNKFEGDAALCVFNAPVDVARAEEAALRAARAMRADIQAAGELDLGVGIACGQVFAGYVGTPDRLEYTVIGDAVNEAARLADLAKTLPGRVAVTDAVVAAAGTPERILWQQGAEVRLRGRARPTAVWVPAEPAAAPVG
jgi:adenylate cyclase